MKRFLLNLACCVPLSIAAAEDRVPLSDLFAKPPSESRILKIIHSWPDEAKAQDALIAQFQRQGFGGVVCNVAFADYLESDAKWEAFGRAVKAAKQAGMSLWLYDERGYPSGNAGGLVLRNRPEWAARGLLIADLECDGGAVNLNQPPGALFLATAFPVRAGLINPRDSVNLSAQVHDGALRWQAPPGGWHVMLVTESRLFEGTHAEMNLAEKMAYPNLLMPEPTERFLQLTHQRYADHLGKDLGQHFVATFTDEPSLMSLFLRPMPYRVLPWSPNLPVEFKKRRGYELEPIIPSLFANTGGEGQHHRYDFWRTVGELVAENYFGQIQTWCGQHGLLSSGHLLMEEDIASHVPLYGDFFGCARRMDAPGIDCLTSVPAQVPWFIARLLSSVCELQGRQLVMCETSDHSQRYRPAGDKRPVQSVSEAEIRGTCNRLFVSGVNRITSYYSFAGLNDDALRRLNEWVGRCGMMLARGHQVADIAVLYPIESIWPKFQPSRHRASESPAAARIENLYRSVADSLYSAHRDFTFVDGRALAESTVESGTLARKNLRWRVVVLPGADTLPLGAWQNLARFVASGGVAIALGALPANSESEFPSGHVQTLAKEMFGTPGDEPVVRTNSAGGAGIFLPTGSEAILPAVLDSVLEPDVAISPTPSPLHATHRHIEGHELFFLINDSSKPWEGEVHFATGLKTLSSRREEALISPPVEEVSLLLTSPATRNKVDETGMSKAEQWDPATGERLPAELANEIHLKLEPYGARFFWFDRGFLPARHPLTSNALPVMVCRSLAKPVPLLAKGEFVRGELSPDQLHSTQDRPAWRAAAILTKGQTDTYLFARLRYANTLDLTKADSLIIDTWIPQDQKTPNQLLVILHEKNGGDFLATTGRSLGGSSHERTFIPLARFQLAGWSKDDDGQLELRRVDEIRLGWGGYLGAEGESVEFSFAVPQTSSMVTGGTNASTRLKHD